MDEDDQPVRMTIIMSRNNAKMLFTDAQKTPQMLQDLKDRYFNQHVLADGNQKQQNAQATGRHHKNAMAFSYTDSGGGTRFREQNF
jgi:hypothetical protein